ncbi:unnamed protein product [Rotaria sp. Silwood1]|nr:unnamed protein product [Rotaria sp. Silwood1]CAF1613889.1 unnamed protein product [Rotaria sp. Silwood1]CAF3691546.1 unnamed protein product [Rotaria sp. Silwood1]CAF3740512.1 unnamed protein product [Rotaria sp. Silwood1]CAF3751794.1 unnamed protein product [Rotaria sp. Silwood1]
MDYEEKLNDSTKSIDHYRTLIEPSLQTLIEQHLHALEMDYAYIWAMMLYDYEDQRLIEEIQQRYPLLTNNDKQWIAQLCHRTTVYEKSKTEAKRLEQLFQENKLPEEIDSIQIVSPSYIHTIQNHTKRHQLIEQHEAILNEYKKQLMILFVNRAQIHMHETQKLLDEKIIEFWQDQHSRLENEQFSPMLLNLIEQRFHNITMKADFAYQYTLKRV